MPAKKKLKGKSKPSSTPEEPKVTSVSVAMQRVYSLGNYKMLRYEVGAQIEVPPGRHPSDVIDLGTEFLDSKVEEFAKQRRLDHLRVGAADDEDDDSELKPHEVARPACYGLDYDEDDDECQECDHETSCMARKDGVEDGDDDED